MLSRPSAVSISCWVIATGKGVGQRGRRETEVFAAHAGDGGLSRRQGITRSGCGICRFQRRREPEDPGDDLAHIGDLLDWAVTLAEGKQVWNNSVPMPWEQEVQRFHAALQKFDDCLASDLPLAASPEVLFQGPTADALTHVGQLAMLRRLAGAKI